MSTRALILHEQGAIWKKYDGYATGLGREILDCIDRNCSFKDLYNHLVETDTSVLYILDDKDVEKMELDYEYTYRITDKGVEVKGTLTNEEEDAILYGNKKSYRNAIDKIETFRKLIIDGGELCFIDTDNDIREVTKYKF